MRLEMAREGLRLVAGHSGGDLECWGGWRGWA